MASGSRLRMRSAVSAIDAPANGRRPVSISYRTTPSAKRSALVHVTATELFGRHVVERPDHGADHRSEAAVAKASRDGAGLARPKSSTFTSCRAGDHQVAALDVAVDDAEAVGFVQGIGHLHSRCRGCRPPAARRADPHRQQLAFDVLHRDEEAGVVLDEVVGDGNVRGAQLGSDLRFANEPGPSLGRGVERGRQELERDPAAKSRVLGQIHITHAAASEAVDHVVLEDGGTREACAVRHDSIIVPSLWRLSSAGWACGARSAW